MKLFYLKSCPHCQRALAWLQELYEDDPQYRQVNIEMIEESEQSEIADTYDYYYVPCFFLGHQKLHEGAADKETIRKILETGLQEEKK